MKSAVGPLVLMCIVGCSLVSPAAASILNLTATFQLEFRPHPRGQVVSLTSLPIESSPTVPIFVSSSSAGFTIGGGLFTGTAAIPTQLFTGISLLSGATFIGTNTEGTLAPGGGGGGGFGGRFAFEGIWRHVILGGLLNVTLPGSVIGRPRVANVGAADLQVTVTGHAWTTGRVSVRSLTKNLPSASPYTETATGFDNRTGSHLGTVRLVTPIRVVTNAIGSLSAFGITTLSFSQGDPPFQVPEPGTVVLLALAGAALLELRRRRR